MNYLTTEDGKPIKKDNPLDVQGNTEETNGANIATKSNLVAGESPTGKQRPLNVDEDGKLQVGGITVDSLTATTVGIDQTTPGTTNKVVAELSGSILDEENDAVRVNVIKSFSDTNAYSSINLQSSKSASDYQIRDTDTHLFFFGHANLGVMEQSIIIDNGLDKSVNIEMRIGYLKPSLSIISAYLITATIASLGRAVLTPERGLNAVDSGDHKIYEVAELRNPHWIFRLAVTATEAPTDGEMTLINTRRF